MSNYKEEYIDSINQVWNVFLDKKEDQSIGRYRELCGYRGLPDSTYKLITSLQRICKGPKKSLEDNVLNNFAKYAELEVPSIKDSIWRKMIIGQHHGLPTRLLDWSKSPLVALHFATTESNMDMMDQRDCAVWKIDIEKLNDTLPDKYKKTINEYNQKIFSLEMLESMNADASDKILNMYDEDMGKTSMVILEPPSIDPRIVNQYSLFSIVPNDVVSVEEIFEGASEVATKYIINKNLKWQIRDILDEMNINERVIYPGLDGIAQWIGRHYYVRDRK